MTNIKVNKYAGTGFRFRFPVDLVFCLDCSKSMEQSITHITDTICASIREIDPKDATMFRYKVVCFYGDSKPIVENSEFTDNIEVLCEQFAQVKMHEVHSSLRPTFDVIWHIVKETVWRDRCHKKVALFTDMAPSSIHEYTIDKFSIMGDQDFLIQEMCNNKIRPYLFANYCESYEDMQLIQGAYCRLYDKPTDAFQSLVSDDLREVFKSPTYGNYPEWME